MHKVKQNPTATIKVRRKAKTFFPVLCYFSVCGHSFQKLGRSQRESAIDRRKKKKPYKVKELILRSERPCSIPSTLTQAVGHRLQFLTHIQLRKRSVLSKCSSLLSDVFQKQHLQSFEQEGGPNFPLNLFLPTTYFI